MATSKRTKRVVGTVAGLCVLMLASSAWAQDAAVAKENPAGDKGGEGYGYEFSDEIRWQPVASARTTRPSKYGRRRLARR